MNPEQPLTALVEKMFDIATPTKLKSYGVNIHGDNYVLISTLECYSFDECYQLLQTILQDLKDNTTNTNLRITKIAEL